MNKYKFIFFDLDHTLWDFEKNSIATLTVLYNEFSLSTLGIHDFDDFNVNYHEINDVMWARFRAGNLSREDLRWKRMNKTLQHYKIADEPLAKSMAARYLEVLPMQTTLFAHAHEVLDYCQTKGYQIHLITNGFEATQHQKLQLANIHTFFDQVITSEQAMSMKPQKEIFEFAMRQTGALASNSIMIGDALDIDVLGAQNVGMDQVFFNPSRKPHDGNPTYEIGDLHELYDIL